MWMFRMNGADDYKRFVKLRVEDIFDHKEMDQGN